MNELMTFTFDGASVRTLKGQDGEPWFVAADVCAALGVGNTAMAVVRLDDDEKGVSSIDTLGGKQMVVTVNESGLYSLILGSRKPEAKRFKKWVTSQVLPSIRKTGAYTHQPSDPMAALKDPAVLRSLLLNYSEQVTVLQGRVDTLAPKAEALDRISAASDSITVTQAAKQLSMKRQDLYDWLHRNGWAYPQNGSWLATDSSRRAGRAIYKQAHFTDKETGYERCRGYFHLTAKGFAKLAEMLGDAKQG